MISVVGSADSSNGQETDAGEIPQNVYGSDWDREEEETAVDDGVGLDTAAELIRSCGGVLMVVNQANEANKDEREWEPEVKVFLPIHPSRFQE